jgi:3-hydroxybutyryl-CoA dehydrogenase
VDANDVKKVLVVGAGVMGHSIAQVFATAGIEVNLVDLSEDALRRAMGFIANNLKLLADFGRVDPASIPDITRRIHPSTKLPGAARDIDFGIEAVFESPEAKKAVFADMETCAPAGAVLASNTSGLDIFDIIEPRDPSRIVIAHWCCPAHIIPLVEVAPGPDTAPEVVAFTASLIERLGKRPVVMEQFVRSFILNRIQGYIFMGVMEMLDKGWATPEQIDYVVKMSLGVRLPVQGVVQTYDFTGLDIVADMLKSYGMSYPIIEQPAARGDLGVKTGKGLFDYRGRSEEEILRRRDELCIRMCDFIEDLNEFKPV